MKYIVSIIAILILTSCTTTENLSKSVKDKVKDWGKNPCYNKETKAVEIGCNK